MRQAAESVGVRVACGVLRDCRDFRKGSIDAREDERFSDRFDATPNHFSFLVRDAEQEDPSEQQAEDARGERLRIRESQGASPASPEHDPAVDDKM